MHHLRVLFKKQLIQIDNADFQKLISTIGYKKWNVYAKKPFGGPQQVVEHLGRYTHKVAITHHRILSIADQAITFRYKDYSDADKIKEMTLPVREFLRRFEQHILPKGFVKIRSYGFLKNHNKRQRLNELRVKMKLPPAPPKVRIPVQQRMLEKYGKDISRCPKCEKGTMRLMETIRSHYNYHVSFDSGRTAQAGPNKNQSP
jgi:hypothetical protein